MVIYVSEKFDYKKEFKDLYMPKKEPASIFVPRMRFIAVDGVGAPESEAYQQGIQILYSLVFTIKMSKMKNMQPVGYFEYIVPPLEGLWSHNNSKLLLSAPRNEWQWTSMIRQPDFVTEEVFDWAVKQCIENKPEIDVSSARFMTLGEGLCVQIMHTGPYSEETESMEKIRLFIEQNGLKDITDGVNRHHEIYLSDPRRTKPERLKTVLRVPVAKI